MMSLRRSVLLLVALGCPSLLSATGDSPRRGFGLFARPMGAFTVNRVNCGLANTGEFCTDSASSSTIGGGFWPKGTHNQYLFISGLQIAGIIGADGGPWANDTAGGFFFDPAGQAMHGIGLTDIYNSGSASDRKSWPAGGRVPATGPYPMTRHDSITVSEGDAWWLMWEGDPDRLNGRPHPLGILVEIRVLGWNYPAGNDDIMYVAQTYYNITSLNPADYVAVRPELRTILLEQAGRFHQLNNEHFGITLPSQGYTVGPLFIGLTTDFDVGDASVNYSSANVPLSLGYAYQHNFDPPSRWTFDPAIFSDPFFPGPGFAGITFLERQDGSGRLQLFSNLSGGGGDIASARGVSQLYRYLSGTLSTLHGDGPCNFTPLSQKLCFVRNTSPTDARSFQSSALPILAPGNAETRFAAYIFAAPVRTTGSAICPNCDVKPGAQNIIAGLSDPATVAAGVNPIDSMAGFYSAADLSGDGTLQRDEFTSVPRSLYGKAQLAQALFDNQFLLPTAPQAPDFFLIPGDGQVTVIWRPSPSEQVGDPFFSVARDAFRLNGRGTMVPNPLYDPNFRQFDVEGYRIYRGRLDDATALTLLAQFDYAGTVISDYAGQVNPRIDCAAELGILAGCPIQFDPVVPGSSRSAHVVVPLVGEVVQVRMGDRILLTNGTVYPLRADTTFAAGNRCLCDTGVPFAYVDKTVRNNFRYFYAVTAFDINSSQSGPASFESPLITRSVTPVRPASNAENTAFLRTLVFGRDSALTDTIMPTLDPAIGTFNKRLPPVEGWELALDASIVKEVFVGAGAVTLRLDSLHLGSAYDNLPVTYFVTATTPTASVEMTVPLLQNTFNQQQSVALPLPPLEADQALASRYGGGTGFSFPVTAHVYSAGNYYTSAFGRGCTNSAPGFAFSSTPASGCDYNGARWFVGPSPAANEVVPHPNACSAQNFTNSMVTCFANAGTLTGVANIYEAKAYQTAQTTWRQVEGALGGAVRGADYNVYWGTSGKVDSVVDATYNVPVPFNALTVGGSWGILNPGSAPHTGATISYDQRVELTIADFGCVEPLKSFPAVQNLISCGGANYQLSQAAVPGPIAFFTGPIADNQSHPAAAGNGFAMYLPGHIFLFELPVGGSLPTAGTVWTMRDYVGAIRGGGTNCALCEAGADGPYEYTRPFGSRQFAAVGAELRLEFSVINQVNAPKSGDLTQVHTVPDPYYLTNEFETDAPGQTIKFVNLPQHAIVRIYSASGVLLTLLEHHSATLGGALDWDLRNRTGRRVSSGVYFYHVEAGNARRAGRFTVVNARGGF